MFFGKSSRIQWVDNNHHGHFCCFNTDSTVLILIEHRVPYEFVFNRLVQHIVQSALLSLPISVCLRAIAFFGNESSSFGCH